MFSTKKKNRIITEKEKKKKRNSRGVFLKTFEYQYLSGFFWLYFYLYAQHRPQFRGFRRVESHSMSAHQTSPPPETTDDLNIRKRNSHLFFKVARVKKWKYEMHIPNWILDFCSCAKCPARVKRTLSRKLTVCCIWRRNEKSGYMRTASIGFH